MSNQLKLVKIKPTNSEFAKTDRDFLKACEAVIYNGYIYFKPSTRQASKWRLKKGIAYKTAHIRQ